MTRPIPALPALSVAVAAFLAATATQGAGAQNGEVIPFDEANVFAELNDTDGDLGFHAMIDGDAWTLLRIEDPSGRQILVVRPQRRLARQALGASGPSTTPAQSALLRARPSALDVGLPPPLIIPPCFVGPVRPPARSLP